MAPVSVTLEGLIRSRKARIVLALVLIAIGVWAFLPYVAYRIAPLAFVNAELVRVSAPIAGRLTRDLPRKGVFFDQTETVKLAEALAPDHRHLLDLEQQRAVALDRAGLAKRQLEEISIFDRELEARIEAYRTGTIARLDKEIAEAEAERAGCVAEFQQRRDIGTRMGQLAKSGSVSQIRSAEAAAQQEANAGRCEMAAARRERLQIQREAARNKVFLHDGANDVPYSQQQRDRLTLRRQELESELLQQNSRATRLTTEIDAERERLARLAHSDVVLPADHVVWAVSASPGATVTEGQTILDLADCAHRFVAVDLRERDFEKIRAGDFAWVRLVGSSEWRQGAIRQVRGSAARTDDRLLAAQVTHPTSGTITVEVELPPARNRAGRYGFCDIGRMAEVHFRRPAFGLSERIAGVWTRLTGSGGVASTVGSAGGK